MNLHQIELDTIEPPERLLISEHAEKAVVLAGDSAEKGEYRLRRAPFFRFLMDSLQDPEVETAVCCASAQIGKSYATYAAMSHFTHQDARPCLVVMADQDTSEAVAIRRLKPIYESSPKLKKTIIDATKSGLSFTTGGRVHLAWASSVARLATFEFGFLVMDEVDKPGYYSTSKEASAMSLALERTETFYDRKIFIVSTPTHETGNILKEIDSCDVVFDWHVPCPKCGQFQPLRWSPEYCHGFNDGLYRADDGGMHKLGQVKWEGGRNATAKQIASAGYECGECGALWSTIEKNIAVENGKPVPRQTFDRTKKIGLHVNRLYSLLGKSGDIPKLVDNFLSCIGDPGKLQGFVNSTLAEPWKQVIVSSNEDKILSARCDLPPQCVPSETIAITCGIDVQKYSLWFAVRAWARGFTSWLVHYGNVPSFSDIEDILFVGSYPVLDDSGSPTDRKMKIWRAAIDTGGGEGYEDGLSMTEATYWWIRKNGVGRGARVFGTKGSSTPLEGTMKLGKAMDRTPSGKPMPGGIQIISLDTDKWKDIYHYRLGLAIENNGLPLSAYLHSDAGQDYASQIMAEEKRRGRNGMITWVQTKRDNHLLDCEIMAMACADPSFPGGGLNVLSGKIGMVGQARPQARPNSERKSDWFNIAR